MGRSREIFWDQIKEIAQFAILNGSFEAAREYGISPGHVRRMVTVYKSWGWLPDEELNSYSLDQLYNAHRYAVRYGKEAALEKLRAGYSANRLRKLVEGSDAKKYPMATIRLPKVTYLLYIETIARWARIYKEVFGEEPGEARIFEAILEVANTISEEVVRNALVALFEDGVNALAEVPDAS